MSTYATRPHEVPGADYDDPDQPRIVRVSLCLASGQVGLDVETPETYDRVVLDPDHARELAAELVAAADAGDHLRRRTR